MKVWLLVALLLVASSVTVRQGPVEAAGTPTDAVKLLVRTMADTKSPCYSGNYALWYLPSHGCPVTRRFSRRLRTAPIRDIDPICRCQNVARRMGYHQLVRGSTAHVLVTWHFLTPIRITFVVVRWAGMWLVDDTYCAGRPRTTIYRTPISLCG